MTTDVVDGWVVPAGAKPPRSESLPWGLLRRLQIVDVRRTVLVDIGANVGRTTIPPLLSGDAERVYAVEPDPATLECLHRNAAARGLRDRIVTACCAVSDADGSASFYRATAPTTRRLLAAGRKAGADKLLTVPTARLDTLVARWGLDPATIGCIKVDVQGWEGRVLAGAPALLAAPGVSWLLEISPKHLEAAGTPLTDVVTQIAGLFSHVVDLRRGREPMSTRELAGSLGYLGQGPHSHTDLLLYHGPPPA